MIFGLKSYFFLSRIPTICLLTAFLLIHQSIYAQPVLEPTPLEPGQSIEGRLAAGQTHRYQIRLSENQLAGLGFSGNGVEATITIFDPENKKMLKFPATRMINLTQSINLVSEKPGQYLLELTSTKPNSPTASYQLKLNEIRAATETDRNLAESFRLNLEGRQLDEDGKYDEALAKVEKALALLEKATPEENFDKAEILNELGVIYDNKRDSVKAKQYYLLALTIYEKVYGSENYYVATVLNNLGPTYRATGDFANAEKVYLRALSISEKLYGSESLNLTEILNNLGFLYYSKGEYSKAEAPYQRALLIKQRQNAANDMDATFLLNNYALLCRVKGNYANAILFLEKALSIAEKNLKADHPSLSIMRSNLAAINVEFGDYEKAEQLFQQVLTSREKILPAEHPDLATSLSNFGVLYDRKGDYQKAEPLFQRALKIREKALLPDHPLIADNLNNLGLLYLNQEDLQKAEPFFLRALELNEKRLGKDHPELAPKLNNLGLFYLKKRDYDRAEQLFQRAFTIFANGNGQEHPLVARPLSNLAMLYAEKGDLKQSLDYQARYLAVRERNLELSLFIGSERQKQVYLETLTRDLDSTISLQNQFSVPSAEAEQMALKLILSRKGRILDALADSSYILRSAGPENQKLLDRLSDVRTQLATLMLRGTATEKPETYQQRVKSLEELKEKIETEISRQSGEAHSPNKSVTVESIRALIPENSVLLEFISYTPQILVPSPKEKNSTPARYIVYVVRRNGRIQWKDLGEVKQIDLLIDSFRQALHDPQRKDVQKIARSVDEKIIFPVRSLLGEAKQLLISPDGNLNLIPFEALIGQNNRYLIEDYSVTYLTSGRDLLRMQIPRASQNKPLLVANPLFGEPEAKQVTNSGKLTASRQARRSITVTRNLSDTYFAPLSGTIQEARSIQTLFPEAVFLTDSQATETALKQINAPRILHIATHGFFLEDNNSATKIENPLLRSGLALAGANQRHGEKDDGILTALEASGLNLWGTKLVVLSACETGLGEVKNGEGVYGLRRALMIAGTESLVMSLWSVSDQVTRELMTGYYKNLKQGIGRRAALRQIQLEMLRKPNRQHPFYWASFIQSGEWANLDGQR